MQVQNSELPDVTRYLDSKSHLRIDDMQGDYDSYMNLIRKFTAVTPDKKILEIGTGTGWFPILCKRNGLQCKGIEISRQLVDHAIRWGREVGVEPDIELANVEQHDIGDKAYDIVVANSVFEHIEEWRLALRRVYNALRPGGIFLFISTNKYSPISHEHRMPFYGWMPDRMRYRFRIWLQGPEIMKLGIDFNQFTYPQLRRAFRETGFSQIHDRVSFAEPSRFGSVWKQRIVNLSRSNPVIRHLVLTFCEATIFVCVK